MGTMTTTQAIPVVLAGGAKGSIPAGFSVDVRESGEWAEVRGTLDGVAFSQKIKAGNLGKYLVAAAPAPAPVTAPAPAKPAAPVIVPSGEVASTARGYSAPSERRAAGRTYGVAQSTFQSYEGGTEGRTAGVDAPMFTGNFSDRDSIAINEKALRPMTSSEQVIVAAGLDWTVSKEQLYLADGRKVPNVAIQRDDTKTLLGVVGENYEPVQNRESFKILDGLRDAGAEFVGAGSFGEGSVVFMQMDLKAARDVIPGDTVQPYILVRNAHDGTGSLLVRHTPIRVVCWNTLTHASFHKGSNLAAMRHTKSIKVRVADMEGTLKRLRKEQESAFDTYAALAARPVTSELLAGLWEEVGIFALPENVAEQQRAANNARERQAQVMDLFEGKARGNEIPGVKGTAWGLYNAVTEWADWTFANNSRTTDAQVQSRLMGRAVTVKDEVLSYMVSSLGIGRSAEA